MGCTMLSGLKEDVELTPERWREVARIFEEAVEHSDADRAAFLNRECASDPALREEVESLLAAKADGSSFLKPACGRDRGARDGYRAPQAGKPGGAV